MRKYIVQLEMNGSSRYVGDIIGSNYQDARFRYADSYLCDPENRPISISLPLEENEFNAVRTRNFFEGLLPEGFTKRCVAEWMHAEEQDYLSILAGLGKECIGAIKITEETAETILPEYRKLSAKEVQRLAQEGATQSAELVTKSHLSLTGASGKVGLYYDEKGKQWYLPIGEAPSTHIVKQSHVRLRKIVANEQLCLLTARNLGIETPESFIVKTNRDVEEEVLFVTKRYDRKIMSGYKKLNGLAVPYRLHQEDFAQALGIPSSDKYEKQQTGYLGKMFAVLKNHSSMPMEDMIKLWDICIFDYLVGNTDNHIKNFSLLYGENLKAIRLAPAYDIVSTTIYESSTENMAMSINGKYQINKITREDFNAEAAHVGLGSSLAMRHFDKMMQHFVNALETAAAELTAQGFPEATWIKEQILKRGGIHNYRCERGI